MKNFLNNKGDGNRLAGISTKTVGDNSQVHQSISETHIDSHDVTQAWHSETHIDSHNYTAIAHNTDSHDVTSIANTTNQTWSNDSHDSYYADNRSYTTNNDNRQITTTNTTNLFFGSSRAALTHSLLHSRHLAGFVALAGLAVVGLGVVAMAFAEELLIGGAILALGMVGGATLYTGARMALTWHAKAQAQQALLDQRIHELRLAEAQRPVHLIQKDDSRAPLLADKGNTNEVITVARKMVRR